MPAMADKQCQHIYALPGTLDKVFETQPVMLEARKDKKQVEKEFLARRRKRAVGERRSGFLGKG